MTFVVSLSHNLALLFSLTFLYGLLERHLSQLSKHGRQIISGLLFGTFAIISVTLPVSIAEGVTFTGRSLLIGIAGLFGGAIPSLIAALMVALFRLITSGDGLIVAVGAAFLAALLSIGLRHWSRDSRTSLVLGLLGLVLAANTLLWVILGTGITEDATLHTLLVIVWLYPLAAWILGKLLLWQQARLATEQRLRFSEQRSRAIFNSTFQFTGLLKPDGTLIEANQSALVFGGLRPEQVIGRLFWETGWWTISPEAQQKLRQAVEQAARGEFVRYEAAMRGAGNQVITVDFSLKPIQDDAGHVLLLIPECRDISERKLLEAHQLQVEREQARLDVLRAFIHSVSHDFRTPLAVISTNIYLLGRITDPAQQAKRLATMQQQVERLTRLMDDMFTVTKLELDTAVKSREAVDLNAIITALTETAQAVLARKRQTLTLALAADLPPTIGDERLLHRAIKNLLENAISYTPDGGNLRVSTQVRGQQMLVEVCDTGIGIAPEDLPHIYDLFFRADKARSIETGGSGLGLFMTRKIVEVHGGSIEVESTLSEGSKFRLLFPLAA